MYVSHDYVKSSLDNYRGSREGDWSNSVIRSLAGVTGIKHKHDNYTLAADETVMNFSLSGLFPLI